MRSFFENPNDSQGHPPDSPKNFGGETDTYWDKTLICKIHEAKRILTKEFYPRDLNMSRVDQHTTPMKLYFIFKHGPTSG